MMYGFIGHVVVVYKVCHVFFLGGNHDKASGRHGVVVTKGLH